MKTKDELPGRNLSSVDSAFLYLERKEIPLNIASVSIFDGPVPYDEFVAAIDSKLHLIPRYQQRVVEPPCYAGYPTWEYDAHFDIRRHIIPVQLDPPGGEAELEELAGRLLSQTLDRSKPLWEIHVIEGLAGGRGALIARVHHALADGISGIALMNIMFDPTPEGSCAIRKPRLRRPKPAPTPSLNEAISGAVRASLKNLLVAEAGMLSFARGIVSGKLEEPLKNLTELWPELAASVERLPFNKPCGSKRKFCWAEVDLEEVQAIRASAGGTLNDIVLTMLTRALARYVKLHGQTAVNRLVRVICPVSLRSGGNGDSLGNQISFLPVVLPMDIEHPVRLLKAVATRTEVMKKARVADMIALAASWIGVAPPAMQALFWWGIPQITLPLPLFNLICTNVPGSPQPLYAAGRKMIASYPQVPTGYELGVGCAVQSYAGKLCFGLIADADAAPDVNRLRDFLIDAFDELRRAARAKRTNRRTAAAATA